jgi:hypothetical protein
MAFQITRFRILHCRSVMLCFIEHKGTELILLRQVYNSALPSTMTNVQEIHWSVAEKMTREVPSISDRVMWKPLHISQCGISQQTFRHQELVIIKHLFNELNQYMTSSNAAWLYDFERLSIYYSSVTRRGPNSIYIFTYGWTLLFLYMWVMLSMWPNVPYL